MSGKVESKLDQELHHAAAIGSSKLLQKILDSGKVHVDCQDEEGISALMLATANNRLNCVKILLHEGAEPQLKSKDGTCAIFLAARCGYSQVLAILLENCSQKTSHLSQHGESNGTKLCQIEDCALCKAGQEFIKQDKESEFHRLENNSIQVPSQCLNGNSKVPEVSSAQCTKVTSEQQHLSSLDLARKDGITPLIMAAAMNHDLCVDLLLSAGVDPNEDSKIGSTALFHACLRGHVKAAKRLICDPRINLRVLRNGETCLHAATISGNPELVQLLLEMTADPLLTNASGQRPLELLIMFINYGNISLTSNLLKVLNLLPTQTTDAVTTSPSPKKSSTTNSTQWQRSTFTNQ